MIKNRVDPILNACRVSQFYNTKKRIKISQKHRNLVSKPRNENSFIYSSKNFITGPEQLMGIFPDWVEQRRFLFLVID